MITPNETMFIILGVLFVNGLITCYACYLLDKRLIEIERRLKSCEKKKINTRAAKGND